MGQSRAEHALAHHQQHEGHSQPGPATTGGQHHHPSGHRYQRYPERRPGPQQRVRRTYHPGLDQHHQQSDAGEQPVHRGVAHLREPTLQQQGERCLEASEPNHRHQCQRS